MEVIQYICKIIKTWQSYDLITVKTGLCYPQHSFDLPPCNINQMTPNTRLLFSTLNPVIYCLLKLDQQDQAQIIYLLWSFFYISLSPAIIFSSMKTKWLLSIEIVYKNSCLKELTNIYLWAHTYTLCFIKAPL